VDFLTTLLFERPVYLVPVLLVVQFVLIRQWAQHRTDRARRTMIIGFVCIPLLLALQAVIKTDREQLIALCRALARHAEEGDVDAIGRLVAPQFETEGWDRDDLLGRVEEALKKVHPENSKLSAFQLTFEGADRATIQFLASARIYGQYSSGGRQPSRWEIRLRRDGGEWKIFFLSPRETIGFPFNSWRELLAAIGVL
jgi:hypothetical protein